MDSRTVLQREVWKQDGSRAESPPQALPALPLSTSGGCQPSLVWGNITPVSAPVAYIAFFFIVCCEISLQLTLGDFVIVFRAHPGNPE